MTTGRTDHPLWHDTPRTAPTPQLVPLSGDVTCDVAVVGAGLVGLTTALEVARAGRSVVVLEARHVGAGTTGGSSAKVTLQQGTHLSSLAARHEPATVRLYVQACATGQQYVRDLCEATGATHDVLAAVTYATSPSGRAALADEAGVMAAAGIPGELLSSADLPFGTTGALRLADQLQVDPQAYLEVLVAQALAAGARVHVGTRVDRVGTGTPRELTCSTAQGRARVRAGHVVVATGSPVLDRGGFFARLEPQRSYCIAVRVPGERPAGMYLSADSPTRSIRPAGEDRVVVGGNGHPVGRAQDNAARVADLERWAAEHLGATEVTHRWAAQDYRTTDGLPFVGRLEPWSHDLWVATGFAKWGMTAGTAAALALAGALTERPAAWAASWDPWRGDAATQVPDTATFNAHVVQEGATGWFGALRDVAPDPAQVPEGGGVVGRAGLRPVGVSRVDGTVRTVSAVCPHLGGVLRWNDAEMSWDCPLHGSRFAADGARLEGPARCGLARLDTR